MTSSLQHYRILYPQGNTDIPADCVAVVGLVCFDDPWGYAVEPLMPDSPRMKLCCEIPDQEGHGGLRSVRTVEFRFRNASAHQTCLCKQTRDGVTPEEDPDSLKRAKLESTHKEGPDTGPIVCQDRGNRSNEIPWTWHQGHLKEQAGFLVTRSLTLSLAPPQRTKKGLILIHTSLCIVCSVPDQPEEPHQ